MSEAERNQYLQEEAKRMKRNQKIHLLSRHNGLMTPQDKNFITRIQLQSLVTATGSADQDPEKAESEDWYYNVTTLMRNMHQTPNQPQQTNQFAQTYLSQTGGRYGSAGRRHPRGGDNHLQRMEQQVQRAVEAAKAKPKNKQLVIEGSLGKISFSNAKTPKPLLNLRRQDSSESRPATSGSGRGKAVNTSISDLKETLRDIEAVYITLMDLEDHHRRMRSPPQNDDGSDSAQQHRVWQQRLQLLNERLWNELKTQAPIVDDPNITHPFIAILSHAKGKKALPRVFAQVDDQKRIIIVTLIAYHVNMLDVIRYGALPSSSEPMASNNRERVELFAQAVLPSLFGYINEAPLSIIVGLTGILRDRAHFPHLLRTKIGTQLLTIFISRAELLRQGLSAEQLRTDRDWAEWGQLYDAIFDRAEPYLMLMFPYPSSQSTTTHESQQLANDSDDEDDYHAWQFLAALGAGASPDQQQRLVLAVKDQVMEAVAEAKARPSERAQRRLGKANLFLRAIGLDVELLA
jgi:DNA topoisomerase 2-associated protein PAT1